MRTAGAASICSAFVYNVRRGRTTIDPLVQAGNVKFQIRSRLSLWCFPDTTATNHIVQPTAISSRRWSAGRTHGGREVRRIEPGRGSSPVRCGPDQVIGRAVLTTNCIVAPCLVSPRPFTSLQTLSLQTLLLADLLTALRRAGFQPTLPGDRDQGALASHQLCTSFGVTRTYDPSGFMRRAFTLSLRYVTKIS